MFLDLKNEVWSHFKWNFVSSFDTLQLRHLVNIWKKRHLVYTYNFEHNMKAGTLEAFAPSHSPSLRHRYVMKKLKFWLKRFHSMPLLWLKWKVVGGSAVGFPGY